MTSPPQQSGMPPVVKVLLILGLGFGLLFVIGIGTCVYVVTSNPELRQVGSIIGETMRMGMAAAKAPGTKELRAAGCEQAMVMDMRRLVVLIDEMEKKHGKGDADRPPQELNLPMVMCQVNSSETPLTCEEIAIIYGNAVEDPPEQFIVTVQARFTQQSQCQGVYAPDGSKIADVEGKRNERGAFEFGEQGEAVPLFGPEGDRAPGEALPADEVLEP